MTRALWLGGLLVALTACGSPPEDLETRLRDVLDRVEQAVAERDAGALKELVSDSYADDSGRTKRDLVKFAVAHMLRGSRTFALTRLQEHENPSDDRVLARVLAGLARTPIADMDSLRDAAVEAWVFDLVLSDDGELLLESASWRRARPEDVF